MIGIKNLLEVKNKVIAFDIDGVVTDHHYVGTVIEKEYPEFNYLKDMKEYYVEHNLYRLGLIPTAEGKEVRAKMRDLIKGIFENPELTAGFKDLYYDLLKNDNKVIFITARPKNLADITNKYLKEKGIIVAREDVYLTGHSTKKLPLLKEFNVDYFIEDKLCTLEDYVEKTGKPCYLINAPYNQAELPKEISRIKDFTVFYNKD